MSLVDGCRGRRLLRRDIWFQVSLVLLTQAELMSAPSSAGTRESPTAAALVFDFDAALV